jgi:hypothetical protein
MKKLVDFKIKQINSKLMKKLVDLKIKQIN